MKKAIFFLIFFVSAGVAASSQTNDFTYQGSLINSGTPANGSYDFEFRLFDAENGGAQVGSTATRTGIIVSDGRFTVPLAFAGGFPGADRWLEISVRTAGSGGGYQQLLPRVKIGSSPYSVRSQSAETATNSTTAATATNALNLGGVSANQYVQTTDPRMTDARTPTAGSGNYIQNGTATQPASNFNITGNGTAGGLLSANAFNSSTQYNIGGNRVMITDNSSNTVVGRNAGPLTFAGFSNSFFGNGAGGSNENGFQNSFFGVTSGRNTTSGNNNSFFGAAAGRDNTTAVGNSFFGGLAGLKSTTMGFNSFFGYESGMENTAGANNAFFGAYSGSRNSSGGNNSFFGRSAGSSNTTASGNSFFGSESGMNNAVGGYDNSFFGSQTGKVNTSGNRNSFFGEASGQLNTTGYANSFFGRGSGMANTSGNGNTFAGFNAGGQNTSGDDNVFIGSAASALNTTGNRNTALGWGSGVSVGNLIYATAVGAEAVVGTSNTVVLGRAADTVRIPGNLNLTGAASLNGNLVVAAGGLAVFNGNVVIPVLGSAGATALCRNASNFVSTCSSSLRYKTNINPFAPGMDLVRRLQPITFDWKDGGKNDLGLGAEDVAAIEPLLATYNKDGQVEGVKYDRIGVVLVNAVKEQQSEIDTLKSQIEEQRLLIESLKQLVCAQNAKAAVCSQPK